MSTTSFADFKRDFEGREVERRIRHALRSNTRELTSMLLNDVIAVFTRWLTRSCWKGGYDVVDVKMMAQDFDFGNQKGVCLSAVQQKFGGWHPSRYMAYLLDRCEQLEREVESQRRETEIQISKRMKAESLLITVLADAAEETRKAIFAQAPHLNPEFGLDEFDEGEDNATDPQS